jgi:hypothetical protein
MVNPGDEFMDVRDRAFIAEQIEERRSRSLRGQKYWSFATNGSTVLIIVFSSVAAVLSQVPDNPFGFQTKYLVTVLSLVVTIISTVQTKLAFERKWIANRMTRSALDQLRVDEKTGAELDQLATKLKDIIANQDRAVTGATQ